MKKKPTHTATPKPLSGRLREWLEACAEGRAAPQDFTERDATAVLAALEHERQRAKKAAQEAKAWKRAATTIPRIPAASVQAMLKAGRAATKTNRKKRGT